LQVSNTMPNVQFDGDGFYAALNAVREERKLTWRKVAEQSGVSASTLTRLSQGKHPDVDSLASLCSWAALSADDFMRDPVQREEEASALAKALMLFRADPNLKPDQAAALERIVQSAYEGLRSH
jgi:transcriptional regulator with XRE-family HTH domain